MRYIYTLLLSVLLIQAKAVIRYAAPTASGSGNGSSWSNASSSLYAMLQASVSGDEVWVKQGTYRPLGGPNSSFALVNGVKLYGGFPTAISSPTMANRDWKAYPTILTRPTGSGNSSLFYISNVFNGTVIDGFKVQSAYSSDGGGAIDVYNYNTVNTTSGLLIQNMSFENCNSVYGGAVGVHLCFVAFNNVTFKACEASSNGGAVNLDAGYATFDNVVFQNNNSGVHGGAVIVQGPLAPSGSAIFRNSVFFDNYCINGAGGGVYAESASATFLNCTFVNNRSSYNAGGAIQSYVAPGSSSPQPTATITNCVFWKNTKASGALADIDFVRVTPAVSYSFFIQNTGGSTSGNYGSTNIITDQSRSPFTNDASPAGTDNILGTSDDGIQLSPFSCVSLIDRGDNSVAIPSTDVLGNTRRIDVQVVTDSGTGSAPIVDLGAYESQSTASVSTVAGEIGNEHAVPTPKELSIDNITSVTAPAAGTTIRWQKNELDGNGWVNATPAGNQVTYTLPALTKTTQYRRVANAASYCGRDYISNIVTIKVIPSDGNISGKVNSRNSTNGVAGITITVVRTTSVPGSPANFTYTTVTDANGFYNFNTQPIYYGDNTINTNSATFTITASKQGHVFETATFSRTLSPSSKTASNVDFKDLTTYSVSGKVFQEYVASGTQTCPIGSALILKNDVLSTARTADTGANIGNYALTIEDPGTLTLKASYNSHAFFPSSTTLYVNTDITGKDFKDTTTHTITGSITAGKGCSNTSGNAITGTATLRFYSTTGNGDICFTIDKSIAVSDNGNFSIRLPARKYFVKLINFTPKTGADVDGTAVFNFINALHADSLTRDITTHDTVLNIVYIRPPVISITGLNTVCNTLPTPFAIIPQATADSFYVMVTQGNPSYGCPIKGSKDSFTVRTNVQQEDALESAKFPVSAGGQKVKLIGGIPNITPNDYLKDLFINFTDTFSRSAPQFSRKVLVTGVKTDPGSYTTVSPQVPLLVLHDPPGDQSYSSWESNKTIENAVRFYSGSTTAVGGWLEAKIGTKFMAGIGVSTETEIWGSINTNINTNIKNTTSGEAILSTKTSQAFSTANNSSITGAQGDVYIGAALNLKYATATDISFSNCTITSTRKLAVASDGFATQYIYTESHIRNTIIPQLLMFISLTSNPNTILGYMNQIKVWQQVLENNAVNKSRAAFVENHSFNGAAGPYTNTTTTSSTKSSTVEFNMDIDANIVASLGLEIAGNGVNAGLSVGFKMETGNSKTNTVTNETSISYTLDDDDDADFFSVDVKKDPVYNTPVFELAAGTASCPAEDGAQPRSDVFFTAANPVVQNVAPAAEANFRLKVVNTSPSHEPRNYFLSYEQGSNVDNETIKIAGSPYVTPINLGTINYLDSSVKTVSLTRSSGSNVYSYEGVKFNVTDACGDVSKSIIVTAQFVSPCSNIVFTLPGDNWLVTSANNNLLTVKPGDFTLANLNSVILEYSKSGTSNWSQGPLLNAAQLANGFDWNVSALEDGAYNLRFKLTCANGVIYSQRVTGIIDRKAPLLYGKPEPTDDNYVVGDIISFSYNKKIATTIDTAQISMIRLSNNTAIAFTASSYDNKMIIVPTVNIATFVGDSVRVIVKRMADQYGNLKLSPDTIKFIIGVPTTASGNSVLNVGVTNSVIYKNSGDTTNVLFNLSANAADSMRINYTIGGTAKYGTDYTIRYPNYQPGYAFFNGVQGAIRIPKNSNQTALTIVPLGDTGLSPNKTIIINISEGGNYSIGSTSSQTTAITSEDGITEYTFIGTGNFTDKTQWLNSKMPLTTLAPGKRIIIDPSGVCILNVPVTLKPTATLRVVSGKEFIIPGYLKIN